MDRKLSAEEEEEIIRRRLITQVTVPKKDVDPPLKKLAKRYFAYAAAVKVPAEVRAKEKEEKEKAEAEAKEAKEAKEAGAEANEAEAGDAMETDEPGAGAPPAKASKGGGGTGKEAAAGGAKATKEEAAAAAAVEREAADKAEADFRSKAFGEAPPAATPAAGAVPSPSEDELELEDAEVRLAAAEAKKIGMPFEIAKFKEARRVMGERVKQLMLRMSALRAEQAKEEAEDPCAGPREALLKECSIYELHLSRTHGIMRANWLDRQDQARVAAESAEKVVAVKQEVEAMKGRLEEARRQRQHEEEYEALRRLCMEHPGRAETQARVDELQAELAAAKAEREALEGTLQLRRKQFSLLMTALDDLQGAVACEGGAAPAGGA